MRHKLALTIALASFCAVTALGAAVAGASAPSPSECLRSQRHRSAQPPRRRRRPRQPARSWPPPRQPDPQGRSALPTALRKRRRNNCHDARVASNTEQASASARSPAQPGTNREQARRIASAAARMAANGGVSAPASRPTPVKRRAPARGLATAARRSNLASARPAPSNLCRSGSPTSRSAPSKSPRSCCPSTKPRHPVRHPLGGARCDQQSRDRFRHRSWAPPAPGREGWMQFLPSTWATWGVDANGDGRKDPNNPVDAICAAARYLAAAGGAKEIFKAILAYNHADWYAREVAERCSELREPPLQPGQRADPARRGVQLPGSRQGQLCRQRRGRRSAAAQLVKRSNRLGRR